LEFLPHSCQHSETSQVGREGAEDRSWMWIGGTMSQARPQPASLMAWQVSRVGGAGRGDHLPQNICLYSRPGSSLLAAPAWNSAEVGLPAGCPLALASQPSKPSWGLPLLLSPNCLSLWGTYIVLTPSELLFGMFLKSSQISIQMHFKWWTGKHG
jgi:hypothetical protein